MKHEICNAQQVWQFKRAEISVLTLLHKEHPVGKREFPRLLTSWLGAAVLLISFSACTRGRTQIVYVGPGVVKVDSSSNKHFLSSNAAGGDDAAAERAQQAPPENNELDDEASADGSDDEERDNGYSEIREQSFDFKDFINR